MSSDSLVRTIVGRRWWRGFAVTFAIAAAGLGFVPLVSAVGWEFSAAFAVPASLLGGFVGIAAVTWGRARSRASHPLVLYGWALPGGLLPLVAPILIGYAHALHVRNCTPALSLGFWMLMPVAAAAFSLAVGIAFARATRSARRAGWLFAGTVLVSLAAAGIGLLNGPDIYAGNHFFGWFSGGIYEEVVTIDPALWYLRLLSTLLALFLLLAAGLLPEPAEPKPSWSHPAMRWQACAALFVLVAFSMAMGFRQNFRLDVSREYVQRGMGGHLQTENFDIYYESGSLSPQRLELLAKDHEYRLARVTEYMQVKPSRRITSYVFRSAASKRRWTGSGRVQVANPWRREIYINDDGFPHPVLEHELAHVVSAEFGVPVFGYSMGGFVPRVGLIEGIAVAAAWHDRGLGDPHQQSAAMQREGMLPKPASFLGLGFWGDRQARAYTAAGSFVRFLVETYGIEPMKRAYAWGDLESAFGKDAETLGAEWREFLDGVEVPPVRLAAARERFTRPSLFERTCARELARLEQEGWEDLRSGRIAEARAGFMAWAAVDDRPEPLRAIFELHRVSENTGEARKVAMRLVEVEVPESPAWWRAKMRVADLAWLDGDAETAEAGYREVLAGKATPGLEREAWFKATAANRSLAGIPSERGLAAAVREYFLPPPRGGSIVPLVATTTAAQIDGTPYAFLGAYLIGRNLLSAHDAERASPWLELAADAPVDLVDSDAVRTETLLMRAEVLTRLARLDEATEAWESALGLPEASGEARDQARDGLARVAWLQKVGGPTPDRMGSNRRRP